MVVDTDIIEVNQAILSLVKLDTVYKLDSNMKKSFEIIIPIVGPTLDEEVNFVKVLVAVFTSGG